MKVLHLTLKKKWFDMIASGEKKEEYREIKPYWFRRLVFQHDKVFKYCAGRDWNDGLFMEEAVCHIIANKQSMFGFVPYDTIILKNGYNKNSPIIKIECNGINVGFPISGLSEEGWLDRKVFVIRLGNIIKP